MLFLTHFNPQQKNKFCLSLTCFPIQSECIIYVLPSWLLPCPMRPQQPDRRKENTRNKCKREATWMYARRLVFFFKRLIWPAQEPRSGPLAVILNSHWQRVTWTTCVWRCSPPHPKQMKTVAQARSPQQHIQTSCIFHVRRASEFRPYHQTALCTHRTGRCREFWVFLGENWGENRGENWRENTRENRCENWNEFFLGGPGLGREFWFLPCFTGPKSTPKIHAKIHAKIHTKIHAVFHAPTFTLCRHPLENNPSLQGAPHLAAFLVDSWSDSGQNHREMQNFGNFSKAHGFLGYLMIL